jgi:hypothetical protein
MTRLLVLFALLAVALLPGASRADPSDIAAASRGVVRVVIIGTDGRTIFPVSHGSGFAVTPTRIVTNAHVVSEAQQDDTLRIGIVPSDGDSAAYAHIVAVSAAKDLALVEIDGPLRLPPLTISGGEAADGSEVAAVGYPMNVDRAQGLEIADIFHPQPPVKSRGFVSGARPSREFDTVLHTAPIARGNSGGPLLDPCGRVLGVNSFGADAEGSDGEFYFAVSDRELLPFLRANGVKPAVNALPCRSMAELDAAERDRITQEQSAARAALAERAEVSRERRDRLQLEAEMSVISQREDAIALAALLLIVALGAGAYAYQARRRGEDGERNAKIAAVVAVAAAGGALALWFTRPGLDAIDRRVNAAMDAEGSAATSEAAAAQPGDGEMLCTLDTARSRVTGEAPSDLSFTWRADGCVNHRTQYGFADGKWSRLFVPNVDDAVSVNSYDPHTREFRTDRFLLSLSAMDQARAARGKYHPPECGAPRAASELGEMQSGVVALLPDEPNERLVYSCKPKA